MAEPLFTEPINFMVPAGFREVIHAAAREQGQGASEFIRSAVRDKLCDVQAPAEQAAAGA